MFILRTLLFVSAIELPLEMRVNIEKKNLPLTSKMIEILMDCHERELMGGEPCHSTNIKYAKGLVERGMLSTKTIKNEKGKQIVAFYVTTSARVYLSKL